MKSLRPSSPRGVALVVVLVCLVLVSVLIVSFLSSVSTELQSSKSYAEHTTVRLLADSTMNIAIGQIKAATKGRDGATDIYGIIIRPTTFDPARKYPVIESIYAGPHGSFVPKTFSEYYGMQAVAELGFIVVQIDGMGTANRSKAFHDVAFKN